MQIRKYPSHLELEPYDSGDDPAIERYCSTDRTYFQKYTKPIGMHIDKDRRILYAARGCSINWLEQRYGEKVIEMPTNPGSPMSKKWKMTCPPKNEFQKEAIDFLNGDNTFWKVRNIQQVGLNVKPGFGKTYSTISAIINRGKKALIFVPTTLIRNQWIQSFLEKTNVPKDKILVLDSSTMIDSEILNKKKITEDIFIMTTSLFTAYLKSHGFDVTKRVIDKLNVGTKVIDEAHLRLAAVMKIEFVCNVERNYYLTATFSRSNPAEVKLFARIFANVPMYKQDKKDIEKNVNYVQVQFRGWVNSYVVSRISELKTNQSLGYLMYEFRTGWFSELYQPDALSNMETVLLNVIDYAFGLADGKMLVTVALIDIVDKVTEYIQKLYPDKKVGTVYSKNDKETNELNKQESDIIVSTIGSFGTGSDVVGLRHIVNIEPFNSKLTTRQLFGRLRPFEDGSDCYFFDIVDIDFPYIQKMINKKLDTVHKVAKAEKELHYE